MIDFVSIAIGFSVSIIGLFIAKWGPPLLDYFGGPIAGKWVQTIYKYNGEPKRVDEVKCYQRGNNVYGTIKRIEPSDQKEKQWKFLGIYLNGTLFSVYFPKNRNRISYGSWLLKVDRKTCEGIYRKYKLQSNDVSEISMKLVDTPFEWTKVIHESWFIRHKLEKEREALEFETYWD
jgi:hypothetical protein